MKLFAKEQNYTIYNDKMENMLEDILPNSIDSIVTDPPYHLTSIVKRFGKENSAECQYGKDGSFKRLSKGFMGKEWDGGDIAFQKETWEKCFEVLKPGGYLLAFGGSRTFHRMAVAIEDAGFEIRDCIMWLYGSGFPKSHNVGLAIDKLNGVESEVIGIGKGGTSSRAFQSEETTTAGEYELKQASNDFSGFGTAVKPAYEPIIVARKPLDGTVANNIIKHGVGAINIDECRINFGNEKDNRVGTKIKRGDSKKYKLSPSEVTIFEKWSNDGDYVWSENTNQWETETDFRLFLDEYFMKDTLVNFNIFDYETIIIDSEAKMVIPLLETFKNNLDSKSMFGMSEHGVQMYKDNGRFPANIILDNSKVIEDIFPINNQENGSIGKPYKMNNTIYGDYGNCKEFESYNDNGSASRYFKKCDFTDKDDDFPIGYYCAKASKEDRDEGLNHFEAKRTTDGCIRSNLESARKFGANSAIRQNTHPTVKPTELMQYLIRLVTPRGG